MTLLNVKNLQTSFKTPRGTFPAVDGVSFHINPKETVGIVGESGCGKSVTSFSIMGLIQKPGAVTAGSIEFAGQDLVKAPSSTMRSIRGNRIAMIFQEPMTAFNPVLTIGSQIKEQLWTHRPNLTKSDAQKRVCELLELVGIPSPETRSKQYPHQLSGGMRQRAMIAMALSCDPELLIADEPTTALDVTIQAQILDLLKTLQNEIGMAIQFITHDLGVISEVADRVVVMYAGKVVETGTSDEIFCNPKHPYTQGLLASIPRLYGNGDTLPTIEGTVPPLSAMPQGCRFADRCGFASERCEQEPNLEKVAEGHEVACFHPLSASNG